jgi:hypothetical protein
VLATLYVPYSPYILTLWLVVWEDHFLKYCPGTGVSYQKSGADSPNNAITVNASTSRSNVAADCGVALLSSPCAISVGIAVVGSARRRENGF